MLFNGAKSVNASRSTFNNIGRDQTINNFTFIYTHPASLARRTLTCDISDDSDIRCPAAGPETLSGRNGITSAHQSRTSEAVSVVHITADLVDKIVQLLSHDGESLDEHRVMKLELVSLHLTLMGTQSAILAFKRTPLDRCLSHAVYPEVGRCFVALQEVFYIISHCRHSLRLTSIKSLWRQVCSSGGELTSLRLKMSACQRGLDSVLKAFNSVDWMKFGNQSCIGRPSLETFFAFLRHRLPFLRHIPLITVQVVDHLGQNIPVPVQFCTTWKDIDYVITGYCENRIGNHYVKRGDYRLIRSKDSQSISASEFPCVVAPEIVLEMSIVVRQRTVFNKEKCPRCGCVNSNVTLVGGWIQCYRCSGLFHVTNVDRNDSGNDENDGEMVSASQAGAADDDSRRPDDDDTQFFRRIQIVYIHEPPRLRQPLHFSCPVSDCNSIFSTQNKLKRHVQAHEGVKLYICTIDGCTRCFSSISDRRRHETTSWIHRDHRQ